MERIIVFDTTLRDGEQTPGVNLNIKEKIEIAKQLELLGVDVIEAGFPASSKGDFQAVEGVAKTVGCTVCGLSRCVKADIDTAYEALKSAKKPMLHLFIATSDIHMEYKLKMTKEQVVKRAVEAVEYGKEFFSEIEFSCEDASRSNPEFLFEIIEKVIDAGATRVNIPDTVGYAIPSEYGRLINSIMENVPNIDKAVISVHCHSDVGMAVANTLAAVENGARQVEVTINGIGERAGNSALEELVMAVNTRQDYLNIGHSINTKHIYRTSQLVSKLTNIPIGPCKAIVGANAFAHESGIHQHGMLANPMTYEIMSPESVGKVTSDLILGKHSGSHAFADKIKSMGYNLSEERINKAFNAFKELSDRKKTITDEDIETLITHKVSEIPTFYQLDSFQIMGGNKAQSVASVTLRQEQNVFTDTAIGEGPVDAAYNAICKIIGEKPTLEHFDIKAVTAGEDALGEVSVRISNNGNSYLGKGLAPDIIESSIRGYVNAINRMKSETV